MLTPGSWWVCPETGQRMAVYHQPRPRSVAPGRIGCLVEGFGIQPVWLTEREVRACWRHWRPKPDRTPLPLWMAREGRYRDVLLSTEGKPDTWLVVYGIKHGWACLTGIDQGTVVQVREGMDQDFQPIGDIGHFVTTRDEGRLRQFAWGLQVHNTVFLPLREAIPRMRPRYDQRDAWDLLMESV